MHVLLPWCHLTVKPVFSFLGWEEKEKEKTKSGSKVVFSSTLDFESFNSLFCCNQPSLQRDVKGLFYGEE